MLYNLLREVVAIVPFSPSRKEKDFWHEKLNSILNLT
jgi:hypothetical protein